MHCIFVFHLDEQAHMLKELFANSNKTLCARLLLLIL